MSNNLIDSPEVQRKSCEKRCADYENSILSLTREKVRKQQLEMDRINDVLEHYDFQFSINEPASLHELKEAVDDYTKLVNNFLDLQHGIEENWCNQNSSKSSLIIETHPQNPDSNSLQQPTSTACASGDKRQFEIDDQGVPDDPDRTIHPDGLNNFDGTAQQFLPSTANRICRSVEELKTIWEKDAEENLESIRERVSLVKRSSSDNRIERTTIRETDITSTLLPPPFLVQVNIILSFFFAKSYLKYFTFYFFISLFFHYFII